MILINVGHDLTYYPRTLRHVVLIPWRNYGDRSYDDCRDADCLVESCIGDLFWKFYAQGAVLLHEPQRFNHIIRETLTILHVRRVLTCTARARSPHARERPLLAHLT